MEKTIIYGTGKYYEKNKNRLPRNIEIIAFADSDKNRATSTTGTLFEGKEMLTPEEIENREYDLIYICTDFSLAGTIFQYLKEYRIDLGKVRFLCRDHVVKEGWSYGAQDDKSLISTIGNIRIKEKYITDSNILSEVFILNNYNVHVPEDDSVFIDVGMNVGIVTLYFARYQWVRKVYGFEPFPDTYQQAVDNFNLNDDAIRNKIHAKNIALSDKDEELEVSIGHEESGWRNIMCREEGKRHVKIITKRASVEIEKIVKENFGKQIILKIDTEGSEFAIFESLKGTDVLSKVNVIMMEYHRNPKQLNQVLSLYGFKYFVVGRSNFGMIYAVK